MSKIKKLEILGAHFHHHVTGLVSLGTYGTEWHDAEPSRR